MSLKDKLILYTPKRYKLFLKSLYFCIVALYRNILMLSPRRQLQKTKLKKMRGIKLNVGCGKAKIPSWLNTDIDTSADFLLDIRRKLPFVDNSISFVYCEHVFEHLTYEEGQRALREFYRCLDKNGILRIAMPDLDHVVEKYGSDWRNQDWLTWSGNEWINTRGKMINISFRWWGHKYLYNEEDLQIQLKKANFKKIIRCPLHVSSRAELCNLETRGDSKLIVEATKC